MRQNREDTNQESYGPPDETGCLTLASVSWRGACWLMELRVFRSALSVEFYLQTEINIYLLPKEINSVDIYSLQEIK